MSAEASGPALRFDGVGKRFGRFRALDALSFSVPRGVVCGLVGPNGAGKTTTFSIASGFLEPDAGAVQILEFDAFDPWTLKGRVGVLPQDAELPERHTPMELLTHLARLQGLTLGEARDDAEARLVEVSLADRRFDRIGALSHGMRRRVAVATALLGDPELVLLDEPTAGLDPVQARGLRDVIAAGRGRRTLVVSSHNLLELELICDWIVMVDRGRCLRQGSVEEVTERALRLRFEVAREPDLDALREALPEGCVPSWNEAALDVVGPPGGDVDAASLAVMQALVAQQIGIRGMRRGQSLEERFIGDAAPR